MTGKTKVLIVGGGFAGTKCAILLADKVDVTLVDPKGYWEFWPANARSLVQPDLAESTIIPYEEVKPHGTLVLGEVSKLTSKEAFIKGRPEPIQFDYCVICTGSSLPYGKSTAVTVAERKAEVKALHDAVAAASSVLVVGGGSLGVELAGEVLTDFPQVKVTLVHSKDRLLPELTPKASAAALQWLEGHKCQVLLNDRVDLDGGPKPGKHTYTTKKGVQVEADVVLVATGIKVNSSFLADDLAAAVDPSSKAIKVDPYLRVEGHPNIYAVGDVNNVPEFKLAFLAAKQAELAARNIAAAIAAEAAGGSSRKPKLQAWKPSAGLVVQMVSIGRGYGVGQVACLTFTGWVPTLVKGKGLMGLINKSRREFMATPAAGAAAAAAAVPAKA